ncbi:hypothetical protein HPB52_007102 [Rhipicephalus sanguineus]|uniref:Phosphatidylinositol transfer protein sec14 n=1 Tax=Rhipicephalus sanguineus TaxID=34632 RepID=A0A9D4SS35_RHISA|nr:hypothetical protein HPB52_007102 [Rhipicephalus sanguineus]
MNAEDAVAADQLSASERAALNQHIAWRKKYQVDTFLEDYEVPENGGRRVETMYVVADMEGFSFWQLSSIEVVSTITEAVRLYEANYPEILESAYVINAPSLFPMLWNIIKPLLSQRTISKVNIFGKDGWQDVLAARFDVERLPAHWGGRLRGPDGDGRCPNLVSVDHAGSELRWKFSTASGDLAFSVRFRPLGSAGDGEETRDLVAAKRLPSSTREPHSGSLCCIEPGTYELVFDNSFSWLTRKELSYSVELLPPESQRNEPEDTFRDAVSDIKRPSDTDASLLRWLRAFLAALTPEVVQRHCVYQLEYLESLKRSSSKEVSAPSFFPILWRLIRPFLTQRTADKVEVYGKADGWREVLLSIVDAASLPAHWGGSMVGPGNDPRCRHKVNYGGRFEEGLERGGSLFAEAGVEKRTISRRDRWELHVRVTEAGARICWRYQVVGGDLAFGLRLLTGDPLLPLRHVEACSQAPQEGSWCCDAPGTYVLEFDNTHSWFTSKTLAYEVNVHMPDGTH